MYLVPSIHLRSSWLVISVISSFFSQSSDLDRSIAVLKAEHEEKIQLLEDQVTCYLLYSCLVLSCLVLSCPIPCRSSPTFSLTLSSFFQVSGSCDFLWIAQISAFYLSSHPSLNTFRSPDYSRSVKKDWNFLMNRQYLSPQISSPLVPYLEFPYPQISSHLVFPYVEHPWHALFLLSMTSSLPHQLRFCFPSSILRSSMFGSVLACDLTNHEQSARIKSLNDELTHRHQTCEDLRKRLGAQVPHHHIFRPLLLSWHVLFVCDGAIRPRRSRRARKQLRA